jgi:DNA-binding protein HU-beta
MRYTILMQLFPSKRGRKPKQPVPQTLYKTMLVRRVAQRTQRPQPVVQQTLTTALDVIAQALARGETVTLPGFGTFYTREQPASSVRAIRSRQPLTVPAHRVAAFRVGDVLKRQVRGIESQRGGRV